MSFRAQNEYEKEFVSLIQSMTGSYQTWQVWSDLITIIACSISNTLDRSHFEGREKEYMQLIRKHDKDKIAQAFAVIVKALDDDPDQDFLGSMYMRLELGNHWKGQFFTPYDICKMTAEMQMSNAAGKVDEHGFISICDPAVGGGAMLIAAAGVLQRQGINFQQHALFIGQDIDRITGMMAYIQISLLGCPGYIVIADTLTNPAVGDVLVPAEKEGQEFWYSPFYFSDIWQGRALSRYLDRMTRPVIRQAETRREKRYTFFFDFDGGNENVRTYQEPDGCDREIAG